MTKQFSNYSDLLTFTRASKGHALRPVSYGTELVTNGTFDNSGADWTVYQGTNITFANNRIETTESGNFVVGQSLTGLSANKIYKVQWEQQATTGSFYLRFGNSSINTLYKSGSGIMTVYISPDDLVGIYFVQSGVSVGDWIDNVSVKEVLFDQPDGTLTLFEHPDHVPRVEWDADGNRLGLLVEEQRVNLLPYSEDFSQFNALGVTVTSNNVISPDGSLNGTRLTSSGSGTQRVGRNINVTGVNCYSVFAKKGTHSYLQILDGVDAEYYVNFDLDSGSVGTSGSKASGQIQDFGNGWYRCTMVTDGTATNSANFYIYLTSSASAGYGGSTTSTDYFYIYGAQFESGSFPTSYIKTTGSTTTRSADVASIPVADFGYNTKVGSVVAEYFPVKVDATIRSVFELAKDNNDRLYSAAANLKHWFAKNNNVVSANIDLGASTEDQSNKIAGVYKLNDFAASLDGGSVTTDTSGLVQTGITDLHIGGVKNSASNYLCGHIKSIKYYPRRLTNAQLQALTEPRSTPTLSLTFDGLESSYTENYIHG